MGLTDYPNGITSFGVPVLPLSPAGGVAGKVFWVGSVAGVDWLAGVDTDPGGNRVTPFATVAYALTKCTANNGDAIYVLPGHTESITAAGTITMNKAGVSIIGLGTGTLRPTFTFTTATAATFLVTAANCSIYNLYFDGTGVNAVAKMFDIEAASFRMENCEVYFAKSGYVAIKVMSTISTLPADRLKLIDNYFHGDAVASTTSALQLVGGDGILIKGNRIMGNFTTSLGAINNVTVACTDITIDSNWLENRTSVATKCIVLLTGDTGRITNNRLLTSSVTIPITTSGCMIGGNYWSSVAGAAGGTAGALL